MRWMWITVLGAGCIPHLYSEDYGQTDTGPWSWTSPTNTWSQASPPFGLEGEGYDVGDVVPDVRLTDQFGAEVSLWQFYGSVVLFDVSTMWCGPCQDLGEHTEANWLDFRDQGFVYLTVLQQDDEARPTQVDDLNRWADLFGITAPVVADPDQVTLDSLESVGGTVSYPSVLLIDRGLVVASRLGTTDQELRSAIAGAL